MIQGGGHHEIFMKSAVQKDFTIFMQFEVRKICWTKFFLVENLSVEQN